MWAIIHSLQCLSTNKEEIAKQKVKQVILTPCIIGLQAPSGLMSDRI